MATTYHDWNEQPTDTLRLTRLRQYKTEILALLGAPNVAADGKSVDRETLRGTYELLIQEEKRLQSLAVAGVGVWVSRRGRT